MTHSLKFLTNFKCSQFYRVLWIEPIKILKIGSIIQNKNSAEQWKKKIQGSHQYSCCPSMITIFFSLNWNIKKQALSHRHSSKQIHNWWCPCFASMCSPQAPLPAGDPALMVQQGGNWRECWTFRNSPQTL